MLQCLVFTKIKHRNDAMNQVYRIIKCFGQEVVLASSWQMKTMSSKTRIKKISLLGLLRLGAIFLRLFPDGVIAPFAADSSFISCNLRNVLCKDYHFCPMLTKVMLPLSIGFHSTHQ